MEVLMTRLLVRPALRLLACAALALSFGAPARAVTIIVNGSTCSWDGSTLTCNATTSGPSAPSGCNVTANGTNPATLPAGGGTVSLIASCSGGGAPTSYAWTGPGLSSPTTSGSQSTNITQTSDFTVTPSNTTGPGNMASVHVTVSSGGGGGGGGIANCTSQGYTVLGGGAISIPFGSSATYFSSTSGSFSDNAVWVLQFTPTAATSGYGRLVVSEYGGNAYARQITVSTTPCDFRWPPDSNNQTGPALGGNGTTASVYYGAGTPPSYPWVLAPGTTYFISIRNWAATFNVPSCGLSDCRAVLTVSGAQ
jgi:hypothetical protein